MCRVKKYFIYLVLVLFACPFIVSAQNQSVATQNVEKPAVARKAKPSLKITPEEIHLGTITPNNSAAVTISLKNAGEGVIHWSTEGPEGWLRTQSAERRDLISAIIGRFGDTPEPKQEQQKISGVLQENEDTLRVEMRLLSEDSQSTVDKSKSMFCYVELTLSSRSDKLFFNKKLAIGSHKEPIKIDSNYGQKTVFITFNIAYVQKTPLINLKPLRVDLGSIQPGKTISKKVLLTNIGKDMLTWSVTASGNDGKMPPLDLKQGRYISLFSEGAKESAIYNMPDHLRDMFDLTGKWTNTNGYPSCSGGDNHIRINFSGTGIILYLLNYPEQGHLSATLNKHSFDKIELLEALQESTGELLVARDLAYDNHVLSITGKDCRLILEGVKILGQDVASLPDKNLRIFPISGATTRQTNYLTVSLNTAQMTPGYYVGDIAFKTNGGDAMVEVFAEIMADASPKFVDIYRYSNGEDYMYVADVQSEMQRIIQNNYVKEGIAFRLFTADAPGTIKFYRWYNPKRKSHYYHHDQSGGGKDLRGYVFEGSIGNIATSRMTNTRELYRWHNTRTGRYFYSTDMQGGKINRKIYRFEGIAGYVR
jgi:hypothetical protein